MAQPSGRPDDRSGDRLGGRAADGASGTATGIPEPPPGVPASEQSREPAPLPDGAAPVAAEQLLPYRTTLTPTGDAELDAALEGISSLRRLQESAPTTAAGLVARALGDRDRLIRALRSEGYYAGVPVIRVAGEAPDAPGLALRLAERPAPAPGTEAQPLEVTIGAETNGRYVIGRVRVSPEVPEADIDAAGSVTGLDPGDPARSAAVIAAGDRLLDGLRAAGHPFAAMARRDAVVDHDARVLEVDYVLAPGPRARFATPDVEGTQTVDRRLLAAVAGQLEGRDYAPETLERVRRDMLGLGVFGTARARTADALDAEGRLPVTFVVIDRPRHALGISGAYETRLGFTATTYWEHRNLFGAAERLRLEATVGGLGGNFGGSSRSGGTDGVNGRVSANFRKPWLGGRNLTLVSEVAALRERLVAYDRDAVTLSLGVETRPDPRLTLGLSGVGEIGSVREFEGPSLGDVRSDVRLGGLLGTAVFDNSDDVLNPTRGYRVNALLSPLYSFADGGGYFTRLRLGGSAYFDFSGDKGSVLAIRGLVGTIPGGSLGVVPPQYRFFAGGGGSVRGYDFQSIGPRRLNDTPRGGLSLVEGSVELRQRVYGPWGIALFADAGAVGTGAAPGSGDLRVGVGLGVRYNTPIGPIRADVAIPLNDVPGNSGYGLYVGIGQAF